MVCVCTGTGGGAGRGRGKGRGNVGDLLSGGEVGELGSLRGKLVLGFRKLVVRDRLEGRVPGVEEEEDMVIICYLVSQALKNETLSSRIPNFYNEADIIQEADNLYGRPRVDNHALGYVNLSTLRHTVDNSWRN